MNRAFWYYPLDTIDEEYELTLDEQWLIFSIVYDIQKYIFG